MSRIGATPVDAMVGLLAGRGAKEEPAAGGESFAAALLVALQGGPPAQQPTSLPVAIPAGELPDAMAESAGEEADGEPAASMQLAVTTGDEQPAEVRPAAGDTSVRIVPVSSVPETFTPETSPATGTSATSASATRASATSASATRASVGQASAPVRQEPEVTSLGAASEVQEPKSEAETDRRGGLSHEEIGDAGDISDTGREPVGRDGIGREVPDVDARAAAEPVLAIVQVAGHAYVAATTDEAADAEADRPDAANRERVAASAPPPGGLPQRPARIAAPIRRQTMDEAGNPAARADIELADDAAPTDGAVGSAASTIAPSTDAEVPVAPSQGGATADAARLLDGAARIEVRLGRTPERAEDAPAPATPSTASDPRATAEPVERAGEAARPEPTGAPAGWQGGSVSSNEATGSLREAADVPGSARTAETREPVPTRPGGTDQVTIELPEDLGGGSIRVAVRNGAVRARIVTPDAAAGQQLERGLGELQQSLVREGFGDARVAVHVPRPAAASELAAPSAWLAGNAAAIAADPSARQQDTRQQDSRQQHAREDTPQQHRSGERDQQGHPRKRSPREQER